MTINYTVLDYASEWMIHDDRKMSYESECDGCGGSLDGIVTIITDRSGSEHAAVHTDNDECVRAAVEGLST